MLQKPELGIELEIELNTSKILFEQKRERWASSSVALSIRRRSSCSTISNHGVGGDTAWVLVNEVVRGTDEKLGTEAHAAAALSVMLIAAGRVCGAGRAG